LNYIELFCAWYLFLPIYFTPWRGATPKFGPPAMESREIEEEIGEEHPGDQGE
jgi:hypothetical protein